MRGRKPQPTKLKLVRGLPGKRKPKPEPVPRSAIPDPPASLTEPAREEWDRVVAELGALNMLTGLDQAALALYCQSLADYWQAHRFVRQAPVFTHKRGEEKVLVRNPAWTTLNEARRAVLQYASEFGLTPAARVRLAMRDEVDRSDPFEAFVGKAAG